MQFDHNSVLNMISWRFGFAPLGVRGSSNNIALALDFSNPPNLNAPPFTVGAGPFGGFCLPTGEIGDLAGLPVTIPGIPVPIAPPVSLPPVPGLDVPFPSVPTASAYEVESFESSHRRAAHDHELDGLRALSKKFGFA
jgi:phospholipase C